MSDVEAESNPVKTVVSQSSPKPDPSPESDLIVCDIGSVASSLVIVSVGGSITPPVGCPDGRW